MHNDFTCTSLFLKGIQNCTTSDVRLSNGRTSDEGLLEICGTDKTWKTVCMYDFSCSNAEVVCRQLGYTQPLGQWY